jgi:hypothetical protein
VVIVFLVLIAVSCILLTYKVTAQGFDEPCHVAAAIELLDRGTYTLDPVHPPLTRIAIGIPLYLVGERFPNWPASDPHVRNYNDVGNSVLYDDGHYLRNLSLARAAVLPFFVLAAGLVFFWTRREFGEFAGAMAALLFSTLPVNLAFSGLAYTDIATGCMQFAALFAFSLAFLAKFTTLLFLPAAAAVILLFKLAIQRRAEPTPNDVKTGWLTKLAVVLAAAVVVGWAGYGFSVGHVRQSMQLSPESMPSFQHFPGPAGNIARSMVLRDSWLQGSCLAERHSHCLGAE